MNVSGTSLGAAGAACSSAAGGIGLEFVRPMGVPPYASTADEKSSAEQLNSDGSTGTAASANPTNLYGGGLDIKA
jgi:hypothetical protein